MKWLTERVRFHFENMIVFHLVMELLAFYGPPWFILQLPTVPNVICVVPNEISLYLSLYI